MLADEIQVALENEGWTIPPHPNAPPNTTETATDKTTKHETCKDENCEKQGDSGSEKKKKKRRKNKTHRGKKAARKRSTNTLGYSFWAHDLTVEHQNGTDSALGVTWRIPRAETTSDDESVRVSVVCRADAALAQPDIFVVGVSAISQSVVHLWPKAYATSDAPSAETPPGAHALGARMVARLDALRSADAERLGAFGAALCKAAAVHVPAALARATETRARAVEYQVFLRDLCGAVAKLSLAKLLRIADKSIVPLALDDLVFFNALLRIDSAPPLGSPPSSSSSSSSCTVSPSEDEASSSEPSSSASSASSSSAISSSPSLLAFVSSSSSPKLGDDKATGVGASCLSELPCVALNDEEAECRELLSATQLHARVGFGDTLGCAAGAFARFKIAIALLAQVLNAVFSNGFSRLLPAPLAKEIARTLRDLRRQEADTLEALEAATKAHLATNSSLTDAQARELATNELIAEDALYSTLDASSDDYVDFDAEDAFRNVSSATCASSDSPLEHD